MHNQKWIVRKLTEEEHKEQRERNKRYRKSNPSQPKYVRRDYCIEDGFETRYGIKTEAQAKLYADFMNAHEMSLLALHHALGLK